MTNAASVWPSSRIAAVMSAPTSASVRPGHEQARDAGVHGVDGRAGAAQRVDLHVVLAHPQLAQHRGRQLERGLRQGVTQTEDVEGGHVGDHRDASGISEPGGGEGVRVDAVGPGQHLHRVDGGAVEAGALQRRDDERGVAVDGQQQGREPFVGVLDDAREVLEIGPGRDHQGVDPGLPGGGPGALEPGRHAVGREGAAHGRRA